MKTFESVPTSAVAGTTSFPAPGVQLALYACFLRPALSKRAAVSEAAMVGFVVFLARLAGGLCSAAPKLPKEIESHHF